MNGFLGLVTFFTVFAPHTSTSIRTWTCTNNKCVKEEAKNLEEAISISECKAKCLSYGGLWPRPTGMFHIGNHSSDVNLGTIKFEKKEEYPTEMNSLLFKAEHNFILRLKNVNGVANASGMNSLEVRIKLEIHNPQVHLFTTGTDESYLLQVYRTQKSKWVQILLEGNTFFGLRHGLETLSQLFFYDDIHETYKILDEVYIQDKPEFTHRGISLDTSRSFIRTENILKVLNLMAANKLNTLHWHMTDSQSFPYVSSAYPEMSESGAYSKNQVYTQKDIEKIVGHAHGLGIRVIPELNGPAHVGEGWPALGSDLITCFKWQPWRNYCVEPPCGQLDPTNEKVYDILGTLFGEFVHLFQSDLFHMGGDEVNIDCWRSTPRIKEWMDKMNYSQTDEGYHKLWGEYQKEILRRFRMVKTDLRPRAILWTSTLTQPAFLDKYLSPQDYVIQVWTRKTDATIKHLIENNFHVILSNYEELYFDCGGPSWVGSPGQNWCSPYIGWQSVYDHSPWEILERQGILLNKKTKNLVLGSESTIWTEQIDEGNLHVRLWPRAAALAERLWSNPKENWKEAQFRMNHHRERMAKEGPAELLQPQWCYQNDGFCD